MHLASWGRVTGDADQGAAVSKGSGCTSPCAFALHSSTKAAGSHESPTCSELSAQGRRRSAALHQNLEEGPSELSRVNDTAANQTPGCVFFCFFFSSIIRTVSIWVQSRDTENVWLLSGATVTRKNRNYFHLGEGGSGCCFDSRASHGEDGGLHHRPLRLLEGGGAWVKGGEPIMN